MLNSGPRTSAAAEGALEFWQPCTTRVVSPGATVDVTIVAVLAWSHGRSRLRTKRREEQAARDRHGSSSAPCAITAHEDLGTQLARPRMNPWAGQVSTWGRD
jgi:hypothetical protein